jgi:arsenate reductase
VQICFSKTFDDPFNPDKNFAAIMTCSDADENCPFVPGTEFRLALTYKDPKEADDSPEEASRYDERVRQIGREILYVFSLVANA